MNGKENTDKTSVQGDGVQDFKELKNSVVGYMHENKDSIISRIEETIELINPEYYMDFPELKEEIHTFMRDFYQLFVDHLEVGEIPERYVESLAQDVGNKSREYELSLETLMSIFDLSENLVWNIVSEEVLACEFSTRSWLLLANIKDKFYKELMRHIRLSYLREERAAANKQANEFRALFNLGQAIVSTIDLSEVLGQILEALAGLMQVRMGSILLLDEQKRYLEPAADMGLSRSWVQREKIPLGHSIAGVAIKRNEFVLAKDDELSSFELPRAAAGRKIRLALSIPITVDGEAIGVIEIYESIPRNYSDLDITMLTTFGPLAGVAIKNARLFSEEQRRRRQANILTEVAQSVAETRDLDELLDTIAEKSAVALGVERSSLFLYEPEASSLTFMAGYGRSTLQVWLLNQFHVPIGDLGEDTRKALETKQPVIAEDIGEELSLESSIFRGPGGWSCMQVPLAIKDELIGLMSLEYASGETVLTSDDMALANSIAKQAAVAIQNKKLQEKLFEQQLSMKNSEMNETLYREREKSEAVLKTTPDAVFVVDRERRVTLINPAAEFLTGWSVDEAKGRNCCEVMYGFEAMPDRCPRPECPINRLLAGEYISYREDKLVTKPGRTIPVGGTFGSMFDPDGRIESVVAIYRDISEQKELEKFAMIQREMDIASGIQTRLLPKERLLAGGVSIHASQQQARMVGGDWYDYWVHDDKIFVMIGDASGTGVGAALFATMALSSFRVEAREHDRILDVMEHVNNSLFRANLADSFATVFFAVLDLKTMTLSYSNAGHEEPLCIGSENKNPKVLSSEHRSLLGIFAHANLDVNKYKFNSGERLVMYTDGVIDAQNSKGKMFGLKRLNRFVVVNKDRSAEEFIKLLMENVLEFSDGEARDDFTVLVCDIP
ncbi:MAG: SpoIIE family protein phosphatase [Actinobacteria bacterium]|nr:SpoIIE family protein phosphatase [Actinomycetota bacterium]